MVCSISLLLLLLFLLPWLLTSAIIRPISPPGTDAAGMSLAMIPTLAILVLPASTSAPRMASPSATISVSPLTLPTIPLPIPIPITTIILFISQSITVPIPVSVPISFSPTSTFSVIISIPIIVSVIITIPVKEEQGGKKEINRNNSVSLMMTVSKTQ